jgi:uncharacterized protein (TIGR03083 family)
MAVTTRALADLLAKERNRLLACLRELSDDDWQADTLCSEWDVRQVAVCLLGSDEAWLSIGRNAGLTVATRRGDKAHARERLARFTQDKQARHATAEPAVVLRGLEELGRRVEGRIRRIPSLVWNRRVKHVGKRVPVSVLCTTHLLEAWIHRCDIQLPRSVSRELDDREELSALVPAAMACIFLYGEYEPGAVVNLDLDWAGTWHVAPGVDGFQQGVADGAAATVRLDPPSFVLCSAGRLNDVASSDAPIEGDSAVGRAFIDELRFLGVTPGF